MDPEEHEISVGIVWRTKYGFEVPHHVYICLHYHTKIPYPYVGHSNSSSRSRSGENSMGFRLICCLKYLNKSGLLSNSFGGLEREIGPTYCPHFLVMPQTLLVRLFSHPVLTLHFFC
ncbi:hypothetical protein XELAEV_18003227mg [Xenopus laevis]|nr:hypothetical protein XELAEV_18003227mg [Xenopus laevis]